MKLVLLVVCMSVHFTWTLSSWFILPLTLKIFVMNLFCSVLISTAISLKDRSKTLQSRNPILLLSIPCRFLIRSHLIWHLNHEKELPKTNPLKLPIANRKPTAVPSPTGNANSQPSSNMIGTNGMRKNELNAEIKLTNANESVSKRG